MWLASGMERWICGAEIRDDTMGEIELNGLRNQPGIAPWRVKIARWVESKTVQTWIVAIILVNAAILGLEPSPTAMARHGGLLIALDKLCLGVFLAELVVKLAAYRSRFWRSGWNVFIRFSRS
jgi:hypothetical protein